MGNAPKRVLALTLIVASALAMTFASRSDEAPLRRRRPEMVWIEGGEFWMDDGAPHVEGARSRRRVRGFWLDATEVSNERFATFVRETGYVTVAERPPHREDAPDTPADMLTAGSLVFTPPHKGDARDNPDRGWRFVPGANWQHPEGPTSDLVGRMQHPVVHIAHADALAYAGWAGKRLPTQAEWAFAASRGARAQGLFGMTGPVWEWVSDHDRSDYYRERATNHAGFRCARDGP